MSDSDNTYNAATPRWALQRWPIGAEIVKIDVQLDALSRWWGENVSDAMTLPTNQRRLYGPPAPRIDTDGATFELQDGRIMCIGAGWEADAGPITRHEAEDIIGMLTWALESDLLVE